MNEKKKKRSLENREKMWSRIANNTKEKNEGEMRDEFLMLQVKCMPKQFDFHFHEG